MPSSRVALLLVAVFAAGSCGRSAPPLKWTTPELHADIAAALRTRPAYAPGDDGLRVWKMTREFYRARGDRPIWFDRGAAARIDGFLRAVRQTVDDGLDAGALSIDGRRLRQAALSAGPGERADAGPADVWLTYLYLTIACALAEGSANLGEADPGWRLRAARIDPLPRLARAVEENRIAESLAWFAPQDPEYAALRRTLAAYRARAASGGWSTVPATLALEPGQPSAGVAVLARRLAESGDYAGPVPAPETDATYGADLETAVKRFQRRHGLADDGVVGKTVVAQLNVPIETRIAQLRLNMERWRTLPRDPGARHILVNIAEMRLDVREGNAVPLSMRVVVGRKDMPTPVFSNRMTTVVFSPYWNVPPGIARDETLPSALADPAFLGRMNMEVVDRSGQPIDPSAIDLEASSGYRFRQRPGSRNSLGLVKFLFPNPFNVYFHDTPSTSLFARPSRPFSHGCVRLQEPVRLAEYVLSDQPEWTPERIRAAMRAGVERGVRLRDPIPVYIGYWTARVDAAGDVHFRRDLYGFDARQLPRLDGRLKAIGETLLAAVAGREMLAAARPYRTAGRP